MQVRIQRRCRRDVGIFGLAVLKEGLENVFRYAGEGLGEGACQYRWPRWIMLREGVKVIFLMRVMDRLVILEWVSIYSFRSRCHLRTKIITTVVWILYPALPVTLNFGRSDHVTTYINLVVCLDIYKLREHYICSEPLTGNLNISSITYLN